MTPWRGGRSGAAVLALVALSAAACVPRVEGPPPEDGPVPADLVELPRGPALRVLVLGDWGTGGEGQRRIARAAAEALRDRPPHLVLTVGDNFYFNGVDGVGDPRFRRVFEEVYRGGFWDDVVFHPSLGNHDHRGDVRALIRYSERSERWSMPDRYYAFERETPDGGRVLFVALDTEPMNRGLRWVRPQIAFADSVLSLEGYDWKIPYGHHPLASEGPHGDQERLRENLHPHLRGRTPLYVAGHSHTTELLPLGDGVLQAVCGGGGGTDNDYRLDLPAERALVAFTYGGWCLLSFRREWMAIELFDGTGRLRFRHLVRREGEGG